MRARSVAKTTEEWLQSRPFSSSGSRSIYDNGSRETACMTVEPSTSTRCSTPSSIGQAPSNRETPRRTSTATAEIPGSCTRETRPCGSSPIAHHHRPAGVDVVPCPRGSSQVAALDQPHVSVEPAVDLPGTYRHHDPGQEAVARQRRRARTCSAVRSPPNRTTRSRCRHSAFDQREKRRKPLSLNRQSELCPISSEDFRARRARRRLLRLPEGL
jgi:hypothetical protein